MKNPIPLILCLTALAILPMAAQSTSNSAAADPVKSVKPPPPEPPPLTRFDLDFPGGTPKELVVAIQRAMGRPLNAIVPDEFADVKLPPLKMTGVNVYQLFRALELASQKTVPYITGTRYGGMGPAPSSYQQYRTSYGFKTDGGRLSDESVWYFNVDKPSLPPGAPPERTCRFYSLTPYLERGLKVDDITTAIQTGWKMLGDESMPKISFHKDTKLLIAMGEPSKLETIDAVLRALDETGVSGRRGPVFRSGRSTSPSQPVSTTPPQPAAESEAAQ